MIAQSLFDASSFTPHGFCLLWEPWLIWTQSIASAGVGAAYFSIPLALAHFAARRRDLVYRPVLWLFAAFILLCGTGHWLDLLTLWVPAYGLKAVMDAATAVVSGVTAVALWPLMRKALALPSPSQFQAANAALERDRAVRAALESTGESVFALSRDWRFTFLNSRAEALMSDGRDLVGQMFWEAFPGIVGTDLFAAYRRCMAERVPVEVEQFYEPKGRHYMARAFPFVDGGITVFFRDVTGQRQAEQDLRAAEAKASRTYGELLESQARLEAALAAMADAVSISDADGNFIHLNDAFASFHRFRSKDECARTLSECPAILEVFLETGEPARLDQWAGARALRGETAVGAVYRLRRRDTGESWVGSYNLAPIRDGDGRIVGSVVTGRDITERLRADEALAESEARFRAAVRAVRGILWTTSADGRMVGEQPGWAALTGQSRDEYQDRGWANAVHPDDAQSTVDAWNAAVAGRRAFVFEHRLRCHDGSWRHFAVRAIPVPDDGGGVREWVGVHTDITEQREAETALAELNRHLEERVREEIAAREAAQQGAKHARHMQALGQIAGGVAHEFNNILQAVQGAANLIEKRAADPVSVRKFARIVIGSSERGSTITYRLLAFARRSRVHPERIDPASMLDALREILTHTLGGQVIVRVELEPMLPAVIVDRKELETALINLATNARDAMPKGGTLTLSAVAETVGTAGIHPAALRPGRYARLEVHDDGAGMEPETLARAAEPFFTTKPVGQGTGLGLSMAKGFAEQSGGGLAIDSEPGCGTTVTLWLPVAEGDQQTAATRHAVREPGAIGKPAIRILLVDDEEMVRETLAAGLGDAGLSVLVAQSGGEALALLDEGEPVDALVTDLSMPGMDGLSLIGHARERRRGLPALVLTGHVESARKRPADGGPGEPLAILRKPIDAERLAEEVEDILAAGARYGDGSSGRS
ncbi:PAS domain-containing protein [Rhodovastum atsumiense]